MSYEFGVMSFLTLTIFPPDSYRGEWGGGMFLKKPRLKIQNYELINLSP
jgi:hypothetical protein